MFLLLVACYVLIARVALHYLPSYQVQISQYLSDNIEEQISFDSISSQWEGFDPVIRVHGLTIGESEQLSIGLVSLNFSFIQSILKLKPKFDRIIVERLNMSLTQGQDGHWQFLHYNSANMANINGNKDAETSTILFEILSLFNGTTINVQEFSASIFKDTGKLRSLRAPNVNVNYKNEQLFASGQLLESQGEKTLLNFSFKGSDLFKPNEQKGTLYIEARSSEFFGEILSVYDWNNISIQNVEASGRAWLSFNSTELASIYGDIQVRELNWQSGEKTLEPVNNLAFSYLWQNEGLEKKLSIGNFAFDWSGLKCSPVNIKALFLDESVDVEADQVSLDCVTPLMISLGVLPETLSQRLTVSNPNGQLKNIRFRNVFELKPIKNTNQEASLLPQGSTELSSSFEFEAMLSDVSLEAYESTPSGRNINGYVFANNDSGFVSFLSDDFELGFPTLFLEPWLLKRAEGMVSWDMDEDDVTVSSNGLRLWRDERSLIYGDFILRLNDDLTEDYLSLALGMQGILFPEAVKFVPYHAVEDSLWTWLSESLVAGTVSSGIYYGYGSVDSVTAPNSFTSSIYLKSNNGVLLFDKDWPYLEGLNADIVIQNSEVWIDSKEANIAGTPLNDVVAYLPKAIPQKANFIDISAKSQITKELVSYWLSESPISNNTKHIAEQLEIKNGADVNISLKVPVSQAEGSEKKESVAYRVNTNIVDGDITHIPSKLHFNDVNGQVVVDSKTGVTAKSVKAKLFEEAVSLSINTDYRVKKVNKQTHTDQVTKLFLNGSLSLSSTFDYFESAKPDFLNGKFPYLAELTLFSDEKKYPLLTIDTNLKGVNCKCPLPFYKEKAQEQDLKVSLLLKPDQSYLEGHLVSSDAPPINAELLFVGNQLSFGEFLVGDAQVKNTDIKGINIAASLESAELGEWIDFLKQALRTKTSNVSTENMDSSDEKSTLVKQVQIDINKLNAYNYFFQKSTLNIKPSSESWMIGIEGQDVVGNVLLESSENVLSLDFDRLNLSQLVTANNLKSSSAKEQNQTLDLDPSQFPQLSFKAKDLLLDNRSVGSWQFDLSPDASGSVFKNIKGHIKGSNITGQLNWRYNDGLHNTIATLTLNGEDISSIFTAFDFPVLLTSSRFNTEMALVWPDSPTDFSMDKLSGNISLLLEEGFLKTEDQKTGVLRLFGVLNAESIKRRLKLDFSDLYKSGVGYDTFFAKASMDQGLMTLTEPLIIDGPAGKYTLNGRSDLASKALDIDMLVELPFSQNVPLAALVLGAPQIGGLVWVADKLLGEPLSALTTSRYDISGTWDKPRVDLKQAMNASKKDRTNEKGTRNVGKPEQ